MPTDTKPERRPTSFSRFVHSLNRNLKGSKAEKHGTGTKTNLQRKDSFKIVHTPDRPQHSIDPSTAPSDEQIARQITAWHRQAKDTEKFWEARDTSMVSTMSLEPNRVSQLRRDAQNYGEYGNADSGASSEYEDVLVISDEDPVTSTHLTPAHATSRGPRLSSDLNGHCVRGPVRY